MAQFIGTWFQIGHKAVQLTHDRQQSMGKARLGAAGQARGKGLNRALQRGFTGPSVHAFPPLCPAIRPRLRKKVRWNAKNFDDLCAAQYSILL